MELIRTINTAEVTFKFHGSFLAWNDLLPTVAFQTAFARASKMDAEVKDANLNDPDNIMPGWRLRLFTSGDGRQYVVLLTSTLNQCLAFVSDDSSRIREAETIGCASNAVVKQ